MVGLEGVTSAAAERKTRHSILGRDIGFHHVATAEHICPTSSTEPLFVSSFGHANCWRVRFRRIVIIGVLVGRLYLAEDIFAPVATKIIKRCLVQHVAYDELRVTGVVYEELLSVRVSDITMSCGPLTITAHDR